MSLGIPKTTKVGLKLPLKKPIDGYRENRKRAEILASLGNPVRWNLLNVVYIYGPQSQEALKVYLQITAPTLSRHLHILQKLHLVELRRDGKRNIVVAAPTAVELVSFSLPLNHHSEE